MTGSTNEEITIEHLFTLWREIDPVYFSNWTKRFNETVKSHVKLEDSVASVTDVFPECSNIEIEPGVVNIDFGSTESRSSLLKDASVLQSKCALSFSRRSHSSVETKSLPSLDFDHATSKPSLHVSFFVSPYDTSVPKQVSASSRAKASNVNSTTVRTPFESSTTPMMLSAPGVARNSNSFIKNYSLSDPHRVSTVANSSVHIPSLSTTSQNLVIPRILPCEVQSRSSFYVSPTDTSTPDWKEDDGFVEATEVWKRLKAITKRKTELFKKSRENLENEIPPARHKWVSRERLLLEAYRGNANLYVGQQMKVEEGAEDALRGGREDDTDVVCLVCLSGETADNNEIVFCDGILPNGQPCENSSHQSCVGLQKIPRGAWLCDICDFNKKSLSPCTPVCALCLKEYGEPKTGLMRRVHDRIDPTTGEKAWVHLRCALWTSEVDIGNPAFTSGIKIDAALHSREHAAICNVCNIPGGAPISCKFAGCRAAFHVSCATQCNLNMDLFESQTRGHSEVDGIIRCDILSDICRDLYCPTHANQLFYTQALRRLQNNNKSGTSFTMETVSAAENVNAEQLFRYTDPTLDDRGADPYPKNAGGLSRLSTMARLALDPSVCLYLHLNHNSWRMTVWKSPHGRVSYPKIESSLLRNSSNNTANGDTKHFVRNSQSQQQQYPQQQLMQHFQYQNHGNAYSQMHPMVHHHHYNNIENSASSAPNMAYSDVQMIQKQFLQMQQFHHNQYNNNSGQLPDHIAAQHHQFLWQQQQMGQTYHQYPAFYNTVPGLNHDFLNLPQTHPQYMFNNPQASSTSCVYEESVIAPTSISNGNGQEPSLTPSTPPPQSSASKITPIVKTIVEEGPASAIALAAVGVVHAYRPGPDSRICESLSKWMFSFPDTPALLEIPISLPKEPPPKVTAIMSPTLAVSADRRETRDGRRDARGKGSRNSRQARHIPDNILRAQKQYRTIAVEKPKLPPDADIDGCSRCMWHHNTNPACLEIMRKNEFWYSDWIGCLKCDKWFHSVCVGIAAVIEPENPGWDDKGYVCEDCSHYKGKSYVTRVLPNTETPFGEPILFVNNFNYEKENSYPDLLLSSDGKGGYTYTQWALDRFSKDESNREAQSPEKLDKDDCKKNQQLKIDKTSDKHDVSEKNEKKSSKSTKKTEEKSDEVLDHKLTSSDSSKIVDLDEDIEGITPLEVNSAQIISTPIENREILFTLHAILPETKGQISVDFLRPNNFIEDIDSESDSVNDVCESIDVDDAIAPKKAISRVSQAKRKNTSVKKVETNLVPMKSIASIPKFSSKKTVDSSIDKPGKDFFIDDNAVLINIDDDAKSPTKPKVKKRILKEQKTIENMDECNKVLSEDIILTGQTASVRTRKSTSKKPILENSHVDSVTADSTSQSPVPLNKKTKKSEVKEIKTDVEVAVSSPVRKPVSTIKYKPAPNFSPPIQVIPRVRDKSALVIKHFLDIEKITQGISSGDVSTYKSFSEAAAKKKSECASETVETKIDSADIEMDATLISSAPLTEPSNAENCIDTTQSEAYKPTSKPSATRKRNVNRAESNIEKKSVAELSSQKLVDTVAEDIPNNAVTSTKRSAPKMSSKKKTFENVVEDISVIGDVQTIEKKDNVLENKSVVCSSEEIVEADIGKKTKASPKKRPEPVPQPETAANRRKLQLSLRGIQSLKGLEEKQLIESREKYRNSKNQSNKSNLVKNSSEEKSLKKDTDDICPEVSCPSAAADKSDSLIGNEAVKVVNSTLKSVKSPVKSPLKTPVVVFAKSPTKSTVKSPQKLTSPFKSPVKRSVVDSEIFNSPKLSNLDDLPPIQKKCHVDSTLDSKSEFTLGKSFHEEYDLRDKKLSSEMECDDVDYTEASKASETNVIDKTNAYVAIPIDINGSYIVDGCNGVELKTRTSPLAIKASPQLSSSRSPIISPTGSVPVHCESLKNIDPDHSLPKERRATASPRLSRTPPSPNKRRSPPSESGSPACVGGQRKLAENNITVIDSKHIHDSNVLKSPLVNASAKFHLKSPVKSPLKTPVVVFAKSPTKSTVKSPQKLTSPFKSPVKRSIVDSEILNSPKLSNLDELCAVETKNHHVDTSHSPSLSPNLRSPGTKAESSILHAISSMFKR